MLIRRSSEVSDRLRASSLRRSPSCSSAQKYDVLLSMVDNFRPAGVQWSTFIGRPLKSDWFKVLGSFCRICLGSPRSSTISRREAPLRWLHLQPSHIVHKPCPSTCTHHTSPLEVRSAMETHLPQSVPSSVRMEQNSTVPACFIWSFSSCHVALEVLHSTHLRSSLASQVLEAPVEAEVPSSQCWPRIPRISDPP